MLDNTSGFPTVSLRWVRAFKEVVAGGLDLLKNSFRLLELCFVLFPNLS